MTVSQLGSQRSAAQRSADEGAAAAASGDGKGNRADNGCWKEGREEGRRHQRGRRQTVGHS